MNDTTLGDLKELFRQAKSARAKFEPAWFMNLAYFQGDQWVGWDGSRLFRPTLRRDRITLVDNRIQPCVRTEVAKLTKQRPVFICTPRTAGDEDVAAAEIGERVLEFEWTHLSMPDHFYRALEWSRVVGAGFLKVVWDRSLGDSAEVLVGPSGQPLTGSDGRPLRGVDTAKLTQALGLPDGAVQQRTVNQGDIRVAVRSPLQIWPDPLAETFADLDWLIEASVVSPDHVQERYGAKVAPDTAASPGLVEARLGTSLGQGGSFKGVKVFEYWRRPCAQHPGGFRAAWTEKQLLEVEDKPFDPMPYCMFAGIPVPGRFWPTSITEQLRPVQTELNKVKSQIAENRNRLGNPTLIASRLAVADPDAFEEQLSQPGGVAYYDDTSPNAIPTYLQAPGMPAYVVQEIDRIEASIQEISGQHEVSSAQVPAGVTAASAINLLQEADDTRLGPAITAMEAQLGAFGSKVVRLVARYYTDQRTIALAGENQAWDIFDFRGLMLRDHHHVEVQAGSTMPRSQAAKQAAMESLLTTFLQNGVPLKPKDLAKYLRDYQVGGLDRLVAQFTEDEQQVNRENRQLSLGAQLPLNDFDDDEAHIDGHTEYQKGWRYQQLPPPTRMTFDAHVAAHRQRVASVQAAQQQLAQAPQLAQTAQQMQLQGLQGQQQLAQRDEQHAQRMNHNDAMHEQRLAQAA